MKDYYVVGLMSGTSLDGCDAALCKFTELDLGWHCEIVKASTYEYDVQLQQRLYSLNKGTAEELAAAEAYLSYFFADCVNTLLAERSLPVLCIASHGHTVIHKPRSGYTKQIGNGAIIAARTGLPVVCDFRSMDVAMGGQGAPLVPLGDALLFGEYAACLNLGGIANISYDVGGSRVANDICYVNMVLNFFARQLGKNFDDKGEISSRGKVNVELMDELNSWSFYKETRPKSLGKEQFDYEMLPLMLKYDLPTEDIMHTYTAHIARKIGDEIAKAPAKNKGVLITGGGTYNQFLLKGIIENSGHEVVVPSGEFIDYKEALVFGFLGLLRLLRRNNVLSSVTGSATDHCAGSVYMGIN